MATHVASCAAGYLVAYLIAYLVALAEIGRGSIARDGLENVACIQSIHSYR
ncbi:hypothetical protein EMIT0196P_130012 [Pseudomonas chlororaphis]